MKNGKHAAFPRIAFDRNGNLTAWGDKFEGLTKREYFAGQILAGMMLNCRHEEDHIHYAIQAVAYSDALVEALEPKPEQDGARG